MAQKSSRKPKPQLESLHKSRNKGRARGAKIATKSLPLLTCSPSCSTDGYLSSCASADRDLSSSDPSLDHEPSASQGLLPPSQAMELVLKDIAKANRTRRTAKHKAVSDGYTAALDEVVRRRSGRWAEEGQLRDEQWMKGVVERLGCMVSRKQEIEKRMGEILGKWEVEFEKIIEIVGVAAGLKEEGGQGEEGEQNKGGEEHEGKNED